MKTGIQVSSFRPVLTTEAEVKTAFEKMSAMGCRYVQLQWIDPRVSIACIASVLKETGMETLSVQDFFVEVEKNRGYYTQLNGAAGGTWICVSRIPPEYRSREGLDGYIQELRAMNRELENLGQKLCFHPVSGDFLPIEGFDPVEYLLDHMPELEICADLYHLHKSGKNMALWLRSCRGRVPMVHFKDYRLLPDGQEELVPAGQGVIDWTDVVEACVDAGVRYAFVEQERWQGDPFDRLEEALAWLNRRLTE